MKSNHWKLPVNLTLTSLAFVALGTGTVLAQAPSVPPPPGRGMHGLSPGAEGMPGEAGEGRTVTGIPLTAQISVTRENTLSDGNHIFRQSQTLLYRDGQGRIRREMTIDVGTPAMGSVKRTMIIIKDPVAGKRYILDPHSKTARELPMRPGGHGSHGNRAGGPGPDAHTQRSSDTMQEQNLGSKTIDGIQAEGRRITKTIAAGEIGNEKPIEVLSERWFSTDLQIPMLVTHSDPVMGTVTTKVTSVTRGEPEASLFQVPSDYKIVSGRPSEPFYLPIQP